VGDESRAFENCIISEELGWRLSRPPDFEAESRALNGLAQALAAGPRAEGGRPQQGVGDALDALVAQALRLCRAGSAGVSVVEGDEGRTFLRWQAVAGSWASLAGTALPLQGSPCGAALASAAPMLLARPGRCYQLPGQGPPASELLIVPFHSAGTPAGALWVAAHDDSRRFDAEDERLLTSLAGFAAMACLLLREQESGARMAQQLVARRSAARELEAALRLSEERYRNLFNSIDEGFCIVEMRFDAEGEALDYRFLETNPAFELQTGLQDATGRWMRELAPGHEEFWFKTYGQVALSGEPVRFESHAQQLNRFFDVYAFRVGEPEERKVAVLFNDISQRQLTRQALMERERLLSILLEVSDAARVLGDEANIAREACRLVKREIGAISCSYGLVYTQEDRVVVLADVCDQGVPSTEGEWQFSGLGPAMIGLLEQGNPVVVEDTATHPGTAPYQEPIYDPMQTRSFIGVPFVREGRILAYFSLHDRRPRRYTEAEVSLLRDVAVRLWEAIQRARAEAALRQSEARLQHLYAQEQAARAQAEEASRLKDEFLATVSHELRTPLTAFLGYAQLLKSRKRDEEYIAHTVEKMVVSARTQAQLIEDLLDVSRIVSGKLRVEMQPMDLAQVIHAALDTVRSAVEVKGLRVAVELHPGAGLIIGDPNRMQQVVWNLLSNAAKFTPPGGSVTVRLEQVDETAQLTVRDTGQGIRPEFLPHVFERFRQADSASNRLYGGLGLGLSIVRHLVELHGGTVAVSSAGFGAGATFIVRLPLANHESVGRLRPALVVPSRADECPPELRGLRVLVVDDQPELLEFLYEALSSCGAIVRACTTALQALDLVRAWQPRVLVTDIAMPGEDGYWLIRNVRALAPEDGAAIPAVALTAYTRIEDRMQILAAGFQFYLSKPVDPAELCSVVASLA
jgi:signal transduction histidine kinase/PAS domain-containing protein